ncbi:DUF4058 family protein [Chloroflexi bacterium TSY]|nr:DUF4058 family protein [Chloroflexi bacterium TSY]
MKSPFPGMDPYLEHPENWRSFHHLLPDEIMTYLNNILTDKYYADIEVYTALEELGIRTNDIVPDVGVLTIAPPAGEQTIAVAIPDASLERTALISEHTKLRAVHIYHSDTRKLVTSIEVLSPFRLNQKNNYTRTREWRGGIRTNHFSKPGKRWKRCSKRSISF